jgi:secreted trypsin-like serine protease
MSINFVPSSYGDTCGKPDYPAVYTNIPSYLGWIRKNVIWSLSNIETIE